MSEEKRVKSKGASEVLVKRWLGVLRSMTDELGLSVSVELVKSESNKADVLTMVKRGWLVQADEWSTGDMRITVDEIKLMHDRHHMGVERT